MTWWGWLVWVVGFAALNAVAQPWLQRLVLRRGLRAGRAVVSARGTTPALGDWPPRWRLHRAVRHDGSTVLRNSATGPGVVLVSIAGTGRPLSPAERRGAVTGARRAVPFSSSAGLVEVAAREEVLAWLEAALAPADGD